MFVCKKPADSNESAGFLMVNISDESLFIFPIIGQTRPIDIHDRAKNSSR